MSGHLKLVMARMPSGEEQKLVTVLFEDSVPQEIYISDPMKKYRIGDVFIGHVVKISDSSGGAFVKFTSADTGYLPKEKFAKAVFKSRKKNNDLHAEDELLVTVEADAVRTKQPVLSTELKIAGSHLVISNQIEGLSFSKKLDKEKKQELKSLFSDKARKYGFIVRTSAGEADPVQILSEAEELSEQMDMLVRKGMTRSYGTRLYSAGDVWQSILKRYGIDSFERIITDDEGIYEEIVSEGSLPQSASVLYRDELLDLYKLYDIRALLDKCTNEKVWLKSGGSIVIQQTEAFVCIDVNSSKNARKGGASQINREAAAEVFRQIRLRQLSGTILIDFINMKSKEEKDGLISFCEVLAGRDPVYTNIIDITPLGIMEVTRKKSHRSIGECNEIQKC